MVCLASNWIFLHHYVASQALQLRGIYEQSGVLWMPRGAPLYRLHGNIKGREHTYVSEAFNGWKFCPLSAPWWLPDRTGDHPVCRQPSQMHVKPVFRWFLIGPVALSRRENSPKDIRLGRGLGPLISPYHFRVSTNNSLFSKNFHWFSYIVLGLKWPHKLKV